MRGVSSFVLALALSMPLAASAQSADPQDRVAFGSAVFVGPGEVVRDAVAFGGDTIVEGEVLGDATSFGGSVVVRGDGRVRGELTSFGGAVEDATFGVAAHRGEKGFLERLGHWAGDLVRSAVSHVLLFLLGLLLLGTARERLRAVQTVMVRQGLETTGLGFLAYVAAVVMIVLFAITLIGIPVAVLIGLALPLATYVGLAAAATVIGAALPIPQLAGREVAQLGAGVAVLFVASQVPLVGTMVTVVAACLGVGALVRTRLGQRTPELPADAGPYRSVFSG